MDKKTLEGLKTRAAKIIGVNVWTFRKSAELTQAQLAERMGCLIPVLSKLEAGRGLPSLTTVLKAAHALEIDPCQLLEEPKGQSVPKRAKT